MFFNIFKNRIESDKEACGQKETDAIKPVKKQVAKIKDNSAFLFSTHYDLIDFCYSSIVNAFSELDAEAPDVATLSSGVTLSENKFKKDRHQQFYLFSPPPNNHKAIDGFLKFIKREGARL